MSAILGTSSKPQAQQQPAVAGLQIQTSAYGKVIPIVYGTTRIAPNLIWYGDFQAIAHNSNPGGGGGKGGGGGGGGGKGGGGGSVTYTYQAAVALGLCEGPIGGIGTVWASKTATSLAALGLGLIPGAYAQAPWGYLSSVHPSQALGYSGTAYVVGANYQLDNNGQLPNHNFEIAGFFANTAPGVRDADPSLVIADLLTNPFYGTGFPSARLADLSTYRGYALAAGLWISPAYVEQMQSARLLDDIASYTNSAFVWSSGQLTLVPYGDAALSANGYSYTPPAAPIYDLGDNDFLANSAAGSASSSNDPVLVTRKRASDALNDVKIEFLDRANQYNTGIVEASDQAMIDLYGRRSDQGRQAHLFTDVNAARQSAQLLLQRQAIRNVYQFTLDQRYILLDPMDIVTLTDARLGLSRQWVRITEITENADGTLSLAAEEYLAGTGSAATYSFATGAGYSADYNIDPGNVNAPVIFEPPPQITDTGLEIWLAVSGGVNWGGCNIYVSSDGATYRLIGQKQGPSRQGVLTGAFASGSDPDTVNTCSVDLSESFGQLIAGTQQDADAYHTLCYVDNGTGTGGELIAFEQATLTAQYKYDLGAHGGAPGYLRRGAYATAIAAHPVGAAFARLDNGIFTIPYSRDQIGRTLTIKLPSFNLWGGGLQSLAEVPAITYTIKGPPVPPDVTGFTAQQNGNVVVFAWNAILANGPVIKGYDIGYAPQGTTDWSQFRMLTEASAGTEMTNADVPRGSWTFGIRARDIADQLSLHVTTADLTVTSTQPVIYSADEAPGWLGLASLSFGLALHYTGVLTPLGTKTVDQYVRIAAPTAPSLSQVAGGSIAATTYYAVITYVSPSGETTASAEASLAVAASHLVSIAAPAASGNATGWNVYVGTTSGAETKQNATPIALGTAWSEPTSGLVAGTAPPSSNTTGWDVFNVFVPDPVAAARYTTNAIDTGFDDDLRVQAQIVTHLGPGQAGSPATAFSIDTWLTGQSDPLVFTPWTIGFVNMRHLRGRVDYSPIVAGAASYLADLAITIDTSPRVENGGSFTVAAGGSVLVFPSAYHFPPFMPAPNVLSPSGAGYYATATSLSTTQATITIFDHTGTSVAGTVSWSATGE